MNISEIFSHVDHTKLGPCCTDQDIRQLCAEAIENKMACVCVPPSLVRRAKALCGGKIAVCTVIGFPLGYSTTEVKLFETHDALANGADEIDMVINLSDVKTGNFSAVTEEIKKIKSACGGSILKVIVETCYLTNKEKKAVCKCVTEAGADFIKTSTGFGSAGANVQDIELFRKNIGPNVKIKASGGIKTFDDFVSYLEAGCQRLGTSSAMAIRC